MSIYGPLGFVYKLRLKGKKAERIVFKTESYRIIECIKKNENLLYQCILGSVKQFVREKGKSKIEGGTRKKVHNDTLLHLYIHEYLKNVIYFAWNLLC